MTEETLLRGEGWSGKGANAAAIDLVQLGTQIILLNPQNRYYYNHFIDEKTAPKRV